MYLNKSTGYEKNIVKHLLYNGISSVQISFYTPNFSYKHIFFLNEFLRLDNNAKFI